MAAATVLVVEDDPSIVATLVALLEDEGYRVLSAVDGAALSVAHAQRPDVILLDIMMPGMDGIEVSQRLKADPATAHIPIIAMSAHIRVQTIPAAMQADDRLPKPFDIAAVSAIVARWVPTA